MNRHIILLLFISIISTPQIFAQSITFSGSISASYHSHQYDQPLPWWDNAGLVFPSISLNGEIPMAFVGGPLAEQLFFRSGLRYTRLASRVDWESDVMTNGEAFTGTFQISQHYLLLPIQFRLDMGNTPVFLFGGPEFGLLLFAKKDSDTLTPVEFRSSQSESVGRDINTFHVALGGGVGAKLSTNIRSFFRFNVGMNKAKKDDERTVLDTDWSTKEIEFGMEFVFRTRKDP